MSAQGSQIVNVDQFKNMAAAIKGAESCEELQKLVSEAMASISAVEQAITDELARVNAILALLTPPGANLSAIVTWITRLIKDFIGPMAKPALTMPAQLASILQAINELKEAIESVKINFPSCSISI